MARSSSVWVVTSELSRTIDPPVAAFTVRHELARWLIGQPRPMLARYHVWRCENPAPSYGGRDVKFLPETPIPKEVDIDTLINRKDVPDTGQAISG